MTHSRSFAIALATLAILIPGTAALGQPPVAPPVPKPDAPPPEKKEAPLSPADPQAQLLETVGLLSGLYLYQSYLNIGLLADGKAEKTYDEKAARAVLTTILTPLQTADEHLEKVAKLTRTPADRDAVDKLRTVITLLRQQGRDLMAFWDSGKPEDGAKYEATRKEAWRQINLLLGLDKK